ncbi:MAG: PorP/SprF family type IX secretion system membrane protein [Bacteroidales bacterium]|nr:PorP/SprF family type IX secretion system membrane protein [Bacteroidales bacterium]MBN2818497.1 PorP/SprF family type IX secretion system membrane protein [Bacteroidales bacterium]
MLRKYFYITIILLIGFRIFGQDPQFSQFYANPLYLGPSFAGAIEGSRITGQYRTQWRELPAPFVTYSTSYDHYFSSFNSGVGINLISDVAGTSQLGIVQAGIHYSYDLEVYNIWHIRPGLSFSYLQQGIYGNITFIDELLHSSGGTSAPGKALESARDIDAGSSLLIYTEGFWLGGTVNHLLEPNVTMHSSEAIIPMKTTIYGGADFRKKGKLLKPSDDMMTFGFLYKQQENIRQLDVGAYWYSYPIILGIWYRGIPTISSQRGEAVVFVAGLKTTNVNVGYSYDFTISNLLPHTLGSHEISFSYKFLLTKKHRKGGVPCPEF